MCAVRPWCADASCRLEPRAGAPGDHRL